MTNTCHYEVRIHIRFILMDITGIPAVVVPVTLSSNSLPIGLQLIAPGFHEQRLLCAAKWLEQQVNFPQLNLN